MDGAVVGRFEIRGERRHNAPHESLRSSNSATRTSKATSAIDAFAVGWNYYRGLMILRLLGIT